jgi:hypothetical protein
MSGSSNLYAAGLSLNFFDNHEFEPTDNDFETATAKNALRLLMMGWNGQWTNLLKLRLLKAVFIKRDRELLRHMRVGFEQGFEHVYEQLKGANLNQEQLNQANLYLSNCLTLLPYSDITPFESIKIPQYINEKWELVEYKITPIELTPKKGFKKLFLNEDDRVFAYGLEPIHNLEAEPHLIMMGTTYPAGQGFVSQVITDLEGFETVGKELYRDGHQALSDWLDEQHKKTHVCGVSLGGSLSLLLAIHQGHKLSRVDALNPAGLYEPWKKSSYDNWDNLEEKPQVYVQKQGNDPVSKFGVWKKGWHILEVKPPQDKRGPNAFTDHFLNYLGLEGTTVEKIDTNIDNLERKKRNILLYTFARSATYYFGLIPFRYLIRPILNTITSHKLHLLLFVGFTLLFSLFPMLLAATVPGLALLIPAILVSAWFMSYLLDNTIKLLLNSENNTKDTLLDRCMVWFYEQSIAKQIALISALVVGLSIGVLAVVSLNLIVGPLIPMFVMGLVTLMMLGIYKIADAISIYKGLANEIPADMHDPQLPRNPELDIYTNRCEHEFNCEQLHDYYHATRVIAKEKSLYSEQSNSHVDFSGLDKNDVIRRGARKDQTKIKITATKAKIHHIQQTLRLQEHGFFSDSNPNQALLQDKQKEYERGKLSLDR